MDRRGYGAGGRRGRVICCEQVRTVRYTPAPQVVAVIHVRVERGWLTGQWHCEQMDYVTDMFGLVFADVWTPW